MFLQTTAAAKKWPVKPQLLQELQVAFAACCPSAAAVERQKKQRGQKDLEIKGYGVPVQKLPAAPAAGGGGGGADGGGGGGGGAVRKQFKHKQKAATGAGAVGADGGSGGAAQLLKNKHKRKKTAGSAEKGLKQAA
jgi:hypothetical protein